MPARRKSAASGSSTETTPNTAGWNFTPADTRILVIDDNEDNREILLRLLTRGGFTVQQAADARSGLNLLYTWEPDLVVCDVNLPDRSGMDVCREIKHAERWRHIFVALISSEVTSSFSKVAGLDLGADEYITRPLGNKELVARIHALARIQQTSGALRNSEQRFLTLAKTAPTGIIRTDPDGNVLYANDYWTELTGLPGRRAIGKPWHVGLHSDDVVRVTGDFRQAAEQQVQFKTECRILQPGGEIRWILMSADREAEPDDSTIGYIGSAIDITERKQAEQALADLARTLEQRVADRTEQLEKTNEVLLQEIDVRTQAEESLRQIPHRIIEAQETERRRVARELHDGVSQLIASVRFRCRDIGQRIIDLGDEQLSEEVHRTVGYLDSALTEVRNISHELRPRELDDLGLVSAIRELIHHMEQRTKMKFELTAPNLRKRLPADVELAAYRIIQECYTNIERHAGASEVETAVRKTPRALFITVSDNGVGMKPKQTPSGLGLLHMRERAEAVRGVIEFENNLDGGTQVSLRVPLSKT